MHNRKFQIKFLTIIQLTFTKSTAKLRFKFFRKILYKTFTILSTRTPALFLLDNATTYLPVHLYATKVN